MEDDPPPPDPPDPPDEPPPDEPAEPDEPDELPEPEDPDEPAAAWPGCTVGWAAPEAPAPALGWCRLPWDGACDAEAVGVAGFTLCAAACEVVWAGAVRANNVAMPTAATALS